MHSLLLSALFFILFFSFEVPLGGFDMQGGVFIPAPPPVTAVVYNFPVIKLN